MGPPALFRRLPRRSGARRPADQLVPPESRASYPTLREDFDYLDQHLLPVFQELDGEALRKQNLFYLVQLLIIGGSAAATIMGVCRPRSAAAACGWA